MPDTALDRSAQQRSPWCPSTLRASANHLRHGSRILEQLILRGGLLVVGAEYSLETGVVEFFDGLPVTG